MIRKIIKKNNNYVLNYRIQLFEGVILISLFNIIFPKATFFGLPMSYEKWKVIRSPHVNKKSMETFVKRTVKYLVSLIQVKNKKFFDVIINFFINLTKSYMEIIFKSQEYWFVLSWNKNKIYEKKNISIPSFVGITFFNLDLFNNLFFEIASFLCLYYVIYRLLCFFHEKKEIKRNIFLSKNMLNFPILSFTLFRRRKRKQEKLTYEEVVNYIEHSNLTIAKWMEGNLRRLGYPTWKHFVLKHITKEDVEKGKFNWLRKEYKSDKVIGLEKWIRIKYPIVKDTPRREFFTMLAGEPINVADTKVFLSKYDELKRTLVLLEDINPSIYYELRQRAIEHTGSRGDISVFDKVPLFDKSKEISEGHEIFKDFYNEEGQIYDMDLVANEDLKSIFSYLMWIEMSLRYISVRGSFLWNEQLQVDILNGKTLDTKPIYWEIYDSLIYFYYKTRYNYWKLLRSSGRRETRNYIRRKIDPKLEVSYKEELLLTYQRFWDFFSRSVENVNKYEKYNDLSWYDKTKRLFQWEHEKPKYYVPINIEELSTQTALFFDKIIKRVLFDPYEKKNVYKNKSSKTITTDFRQWVYDKWVPDHGLRTRDELDQFLAGFSSFYNLSEITVGDKYWFKPYKNKHTDDSAKMVGDYDYYYITALGEEEIDDIECVAVFKNNKWIDVIDFQSYLVHLRGENSFLMEREIILNEVSKYYELFTYKNDFNRRVLWSENYSKTLSDLNIDVTKKDNGLSYYENLLNDTWGIENSLMWPSETFPGAHKYSDFILRLSDFVDQLGFDTLLLIWKWLSICIFLFFVDYIFYSPFLKNYNFVINYKNYRHKLNEAVFRKWGFSFFFYTEGISIFAQIVVFLLGAQYIDFLSNEYKKKDKSHSKVFNAMSEKLETPYQAEEYINRPLVKENMLNRDYGFGSITNKQSEMWFLIKRIPLAWERFSEAFQLLMQRFLHSEDSFFRIFIICLKYDKIALQSTKEYFYQLPFRIVDFSIQSYYNVIKFISDTIIDTINLFFYCIARLKYYFNYCLDFCLNVWTEFFSKPLFYWYHKMIEKIIELVLFIKDEILEFFHFISLLFIDWLVLLQYYFLTRFFEYLQSITNWWVSYIKEWYWHHLWWQHTLNNRFHEHTGWFSHLYQSDSQKHPESEFTPSAYWGSFYDFLTKTKLIYIWQADSWNNLKDSVSNTLWMEYNKDISYIENLINYYLIIREEGLRNLLNRELNVHESWSNWYLFEVLFEEWYYRVCMWVYVRVYDMSERKDYLMHKILYHFYKLTRIDWWLYNSAFSFIYYPLCSIWRNLVSQTYFTMKFIHRIYRRLSYGSSSFSYKKVSRHLKVYISEILEEITYSIYFFIQMVFYPVIGVWWYLKKTYFFACIFDFIYRAACSVNSFLKAILNKFHLGWVYDKYEKFIFNLKQLYDIVKIDERIDIKLSILFSAGEEVVKKHEIIYEEYVKAEKEEKEKNNVKMIDLIRNRKKYSQELVVSYIENHAKYKSNDWKLSKVTKKACIELGVDFSKVNIFEDLFPLTPNERVLHASGFLDVATRNLNILKKLGYFNEFIILEGIYYEQGLLPEMDNITKENVVEDLKIFWLPRDYYFEIPQIRLIKHALSYMNELYGRFVIFFFDYVVYGGWFSFFYRFIIDGPFILFKFLTITIPSYYQNIHVVKSWIENIKNNLMDIYDRVCLGYSNFIDYFYIYHGIFVLPSDFKIKIKDAYFDKDERIAWAKYILISLRDHFYYWFYNVPYTEWKAIYTDFLEFVEVKDTFKGSVYQGLENKFKLEDYENIRNNQLLNLDPAINSKINMWAIFYMERWEKIDFIKGTQFEFAFLLLKESISEYSKLKNSYIEKVFEEYYPNFLNKCNNRSYEAHWYSKFQGNIFLEPNELISYYNLRVKYSIIFLIKFLFENVLDSIVYSTNIILEDFSRFIFSVITFPFNLYNIFEQFYKEFLEFKLSLFYFISNHKFDSFEIIRNSFNLFYSIIYNFIKNIFEIFVNKMNKSYIYPLEQQFSIGIESLHKKNFKSFFINFFFLDNKFDWSNTKKIIHFIYMQLKEDFSQLLELIRIYFKTLTEPYYIYFKFEIENMIFEYFRRVHDRVIELRDVAYNNDYGLIGSFFEIPYLLLRYMVKDIISPFKFFYDFLLRLKVFDVLINIVVYSKSLYVYILEQFVYYSFLVVPFFIQVYYDLYFLIMSIISEIIFRFSNIVYYIFIDVCSLNIIAKYLIIIVRSFYELFLKIIDLINLIIWSIWNFDFTTIRIYFNMFFIQFYQYVTYGNWWWDNSFLLGVYKLLYPFFKWINYYLYAPKSDSIPVLIRGDLNRGLPFLIGEEARKNMSTEQKNNIKAFFNYQGTNLGYPREFITLWDINKHILDYYMYLEKSNMPVVVKKYFFNRYLYNTFYEAMAVCGGRTIPRFDIVRLFMDILTKNNKFERIAYESDMGSYYTENMNDIYPKIMNLYKKAKKAENAAYNSVLNKAMDEKVVLTKEEKEKSRLNKKALVRQTFYKDKAELEGTHNYTTARENWSQLSDRSYWFGRDTMATNNRTFMKEFSEPYLEIDKREEHSSVISYYKQLSDAWETYEFLSFNQKIYNFYLDTFGPSFAYLLYHFPGHTLQLNDSRFNYREKVLFLRNFFYTNESECLTNLSLVNRLNSLDFQLYMKQSELLSKYFRIDKDFRLVLNPYNEMRLWSMYTLGETMFHLEKKLDIFPGAQSLSSQLNDYLEKNFGGELYFYEESEFDTESSTEKDERVALPREIDFVTGVTANYYEYDWGRIDLSEGVAYSKMLPSPLKWIYETEFYKENKYLPTFFPSRDQSYSNINFLDTWMESIDTGSSLQIRRLGEIKKQRYLYSTAPVDANYGKDWGLGIISTDYDELLPLDFHSYADNWTWQQAFLNTYLCTMDFYYNYNIRGLNTLIKKDSFQKTPSYDTSLIQGSPWLDSNEVDRIIRERMTNKPLCYDYWIHYEGMDSVSSSFNKFENLSSFNNTVLYDAPSHNQIGFQDPASPIMEGIIDLHHDLFFFLILVSVFVSWILFNIIYYFNTTNYNLRIRLRDRIQYEVRELLFDFIRVINYCITRLVNSLSNNPNGSSVSKMLIGYLYEINIKLIYWQEKYLNESYHEKELEHILINAKINSDGLLPNNMTDLFKYLGKNDYTDIEYFFNEEEKKGYFISKKNSELYTQFKNDPNNNFHTGEVSVILNNLLAVRNLQLKLNDTYFNDISKEKKYIFEMMDNDILKYEHFEEDFEQYKLKEESVWFPQLFTHNTTIEIIWTIIPAIILILIAIPSFSLLYAMDQIWQPLFTIKVLGNQWYWSYEYC